MKGVGWQLYSFSWMVGPCFSLCFFFVWRKNLRIKRRYLKCKILGYPPKQISVATPLYAPYLDTLLFSDFSQKLLNQFQQNFSWTSSLGPTPACPYLVIIHSLWPWPWDKTYLPPIGPCVKFQFALYQKIFNLVTSNKVCRSMYLIEMFSCEE